MVRGEAQQTKVHFKGKEDDFIVFVQDPDLFKKWKTDKSIPLAHFISSFKIFVTHRQGNQGTFDAAPKSTLENEFGTSVDNDVIVKILEKGDAHNVEFPDRHATRNDSKGSLAGH